jgi:hypothetical protein
VEQTSLNNSMLKKSCSQSVYFVIIKCHQWEIKIENVIENYNRNHNKTKLGSVVGTVKFHQMDLLDKNMDIHSVNIKCQQQWIRTEK